MYRCTWFHIFVAKKHGGIAGEQTKTQQTHHLAISDWEFQMQKFCGVCYTFCLWWPLNYIVHVRSWKDMNAGILNVHLFFSTSFMKIKVFIFNIDNNIKNCICFLFVSYLKSTDYVIIPYNNKKYYYLIMAFLFRKKWYFFFRRTKLVLLFQLSWNCCLQLTFTCNISVKLLALLLLQRYELSSCHYIKALYFTRLYISQGFIYNSHTIYCLIIMSNSVTFIQVFWLK